MLARVGDVVALLFVVAVVYVLVRPQSQAGLFVDAVVDTAVAVVRRAADLGS